MVKNYVDYISSKKTIIQQNYNDYFCDEKSIVKAFFYNVDKDGDPVYYDKVCDTDFDLLFKKSDLTKVENYYFCSMLRLLTIILPYASRNKNKRSEKLTVVFDFKNVNVFKFIKGNMKKFMKVATYCS